MIVGVAALLGIAWHISERQGRLLAFLHPDQYQEKEGHQQWMGLIAFGSGGVEGLGLGNGRQKMLYLPYAHTDFIFPVIGEELGLRVTLIVVFCYLLIVTSGILISLNAKDRFGMLLGFGCTAILGLQAAINVGVTTSLLPNKGLPLPFISYGGSNLFFCLDLHRNPGQHLQARQRGQNDCQQRNDGSGQACFPNIAVPSDESRNRMWRNRWAPVPWTGRCRGLERIADMRFFC